MAGGEYLRLRYKDPGPTDLITQRVNTLRVSIPIAAQMRGFLFYLPRPEPEPIGVSVEPLGEALGPRVFPDGLWVLFGEVTVVPAFPVVVPFIDEPVALPVAAEPPAAGLPPAVAPACASAKVPESANAVANAIVLIFMLVFLGFCPR
jgi:hypothetical protein